MAAEPAGSPERKSALRETLQDTFARTVEGALYREVRGGEIPRHLAIIMDGNRRFARKLGIDPALGHEIGRDTLENVLDWCLDLGVRYLTVYAFSTENFARSSDEVLKLMDLFETNFRKMGDDARVHKHRIHIRAIGQHDLLPPRVREAIRYAEEKTKDYAEYHYTIAVAYGGREEIVKAVRTISRDVAAGRLRPEDIDESHISKALYTSELPDPDLILRTSGEERISNFLLWQLAYAELYFSDVYWPGFRRIDFLRVIRAFQQRRRRYGS